MQINKTVCVVGLGYIGLPTAAMLCSSGYRVFGVDIKPEVVDSLNSGLPHFSEPGLDALIAKSVQDKTFTASLLPKPADIFIICVPTPFKFVDDKREPDIQFVTAATKAIASCIEPGAMVILESTSPVGTTETVTSILEESGVDVTSLDIAYCPERVLPGNILVEIVENDRIVGGINTQSARKVANFYREFTKGKVFETNAKTAEMCKLTENSFRDTNIAFANELSILCDSIGIDPWELIALANKHPRVNILQPSVGVGGHCIAVDPWFLISKFPEKTTLIHNARDINTQKTEWVVERINETVDSMKQKMKRDIKVACLGITFKPDIDDLRESPALSVVEALLDINIDVMVVEPNIKNHQKFELTPLETAIKNSDLVVSLVRHKEFVNSYDLQNSNPETMLDFCNIRTYG